MSKITAVFLAITTFLSSFFSMFIMPEAPEDTSEFTPVIRFLVASDSHVNTMGDTNCLRIEKAIKLAYEIADNDEEYNALDAALFVGDLTDEGMRTQFLGFKSALDAVIRDDTEFMAILAKAHDGEMLGKKSLSYFSSLTGDESDFHKVINGFHFIGLSASKTQGEHYSEYQCEWLKAELDKAVAQDPTKPVFVVHHEHVKNTVFGSSDFEGWGVDYFKDILEQYPQVVHFSGHSHYPLNDPRSLWQGKFTAVGTGSLYYVELTVDDERTVHPDGYKQESNFWIVEVDADNSIRLRGIDLMEEAILCEYILENPADSSNREYTPEKRAAASKPHVFPDGAEVKMKKFFGNYTADLPAAESTDSMPVFIYRAYVYNADGEVVAESKTLADYYSATTADNIEIKLGKLPDDADVIKFVAETAYGVQSDSIEYKL